MKNKEYIKGFEAGAETTAEQSNEINAIAQEEIRKGLMKEIRRVFKEVKNPYGRDYYGLLDTTIETKEYLAYEQARDMLLRATLKIFK